MSITQNNIWNVLFNQFPSLTEEINLFQNNPDIDYHSSLMQFSNNFNTSNTSSNISANYNNIYNKYDLSIYSTSQQLSNTFNNIFNSNLINVNNAERAFTDSSNYTYNTSNIIFNYILNTYTPQYLFNNSNLFISNQLLLKQDNLQELTNLVGIGSNITELDYNKITLNKPTTFPTDTSHIYTKTDVNNITILSNFYNKTDSDNLLNEKQPNLTNLTTLLGVGSAITQLDYNKITLNKPLKFQPDTTNIYTKTEINNIISLTHFYNKDDSDSLLNNKQPNLTNLTTLLGIGSEITQLDYNKITLNKPTSFQPDITNIYTKTEVDNITTLTSFYNKTDSDLRYLQLNDNTLNIPKIRVLTSGENVNSLIEMIWDNTTSITSLSTYWDMIIGNTTNYYAIRDRKGNDTKIRLIIDDLGNVGIGTTTNSSYNLYVNGSINSTSLYQNGSLIDFANFTTDNELTNGLALKQNNLTASTIILGIGSAITELDYNKITSNPLTFATPLSKNATNVVSINLGSYSTTGSDTNYVLKTGSTMSGSLNITTASTRLTFGNRYENYLVDLFQGTYGIGLENGFMNFNVPSTAGYKFNSGVNNTILFSSGGLITANSFSGSGSNITNIDYNNIKSNALTFANPLSKNSNNIVSINLGSYSTTGNDANYLKLTGGTISGALSLSSSLTISGASSKITFGKRHLDYMVDLYDGKYGIGAETNYMNFRADVSGGYKFYTNGTTNIATLLSTGVFNVSGNLQENSTNLSAKYATITSMNSLVPNTAINLTSGDKTITGTLTITNDLTLSSGNIIYFNNGATDGRMLHTSGQLRIQFDDYLYFDSVSSNSNAYINKGVFNGYGYNTLSDERIKYDITKFNDNNLLENFSKIELKNFKYNNNNNINLGFIAQEVEKIYPNSVSYGKDFIPNINKNVVCSNNQLIFTEDFDISFLNVNDILLIDNNNIEIIKIENNVITINKSLNKSSVFVYGTQVNDFRNIDKSYLYSVNILATQELIRINKEQKEIIENQQKRIESIENELILIKSKLGI